MLVSAAIDPLLDGGLLLSLCPAEHCEVTVEGICDELVLRSGKVEADVMRICNLYVTEMWIK